VTAPSAGASTRPYDAIVVTAIGARVPPALIEQLVGGGVSGDAVGPPRGRQVLIRGVKKGFKLHAKEIAEHRAGAGRAAATATASRPATGVTHATTPSGSGVPRDRTTPETIDDLAWAREPQLLARQPFERAVVRAQAMDALAQLLVLVQETRDRVPSSRCSPRERAEVQQAAASEHDREIEHRRARARERQARCVGEHATAIAPHAARSYTSERHVTSDTPRRPHEDRQDSRA
jgi:hypothetical protein